MDPTKKTKKHRSPALKHDRKRKNISTSEQSSASRMDVPTKGTKRKASLNRKTLIKMAMIAGKETQTTPEDDVTVKRGKRKVRDDGEGQKKPKKDKRRRLDLLKYDTELPSTSVDTESSNTSVDVSKRGDKRKVATTDGEEPNQKKKRPDLKDAKKDTNVFLYLKEFEAKYQQLEQLGEGGCGSVFAGYRIADHLPVAIKHIPKDKVPLKHVDDDGNKISIEVAIMLKLAAESEGTSAPISLLDWFDLDKKLILVLERPMPSTDLHGYIEDNGGSLDEKEAKIILRQLVDAVIDLEKQHIFHRDIKVENILIETSSDFPRVRLIDFGLSCFVKRGASYRVFYGTPAHIPPEWFILGTYRAGPTTVWQMGTVLFDTVHSDREFETMKFITHKLRISRKLSKDCQDFLRTCLTVFPDQRITLEQLRNHPWLG
ncbi:serine/threonine-protein kinase pim-1-like [Anoplopoma fimbria]|uniref:serine/threonine-protein kinase pim-1-like n=1 Tax=Anoplopoma fimbria TaxID=229290 RepID=UPI0023EADB37|nr:serine/threonine-protein kinase pim-1-like [Anoplopoma fimbria]